MPSSYTESNRLHSTNQRRQEFEDKLMEYRNEQALEAEIDSIIEDAYDSYETRWTDSNESRYFDDIGDSY